ncbi:MAG: LysR family transcriptional regulator [Lachnospiraceae bacterium]|nr:LysR family transcriptional regulator [Lachnospiraceae bacterium]
MELRHIRYFMAVAEELNFTKAAEKLHMAQPPLSRQIQDLEKELGARLFHRTPHMLKLTEEGVLFSQYAVQILELARRSAEGIRELHTGLTGTLYLASVEGHAPRLISEWIAGFHKLHPHVQYDLWNGSSDEVTDRVTKGLCDLGIITSPYSTEGLSVLPVYDEPWVAILPKDHPLALEDGDTIRLEKLSPFELIIPSRRSRLQEITGWFELSGNRPHILCRISNTLNAYMLVEQGVGIAIYPASANDIRTPDSICIRRITDPSVTVSYALIWKKNQNLSHAAEALIRYVRDGMSAS